MRLKLIPTASKPGDTESKGLHRQSLCMLRQIQQNWLRWVVCCLLEIKTDAVHLNLSPGGLGFRVF